MDTLVLFESGLYLVHVIAILFVACELGERFSRTLEEVDDFLCQLNWYYLPIEFQRVFPTILINSQQPVVLKCFGCISCSRDQFKTVGVRLNQTNPCCTPTYFYYYLRLFSRSLIKAIRDLWYSIKLTTHEYIPTVNLDYRFFVNKNNQ